MDLADPDPQHCLADLRSNQFKRPLLQLRTLHFGSTWFGQNYVPNLYKILYQKNSVADLDPLVRGTDPPPHSNFFIIKQKWYENLNFYCFVTSL
jgi:hypothetical protein